MLADEFGERAQGIPYRWFGSTPRPVLAIELLSRDGSALRPTPAIVDSGADSTTLPVEWAARMGIDIERDCVEKPCGTAGGEVKGFYCAGGVEAMILGERLRLDATFNRGLDFVLLGRRDFFSAFRVLFDQRAQMFTVERYAEVGDRVGGADRIHS